MMCELTVNQIISAIAAPVLIVVLVLVLVVLVSKRNKTDTLASLAYELQNLIRACKKQDPDLKELKTLDSTGAKCALLCDRAVGHRRGARSHSRRLQNFVRAFRRKDSRKGM